MTVSPRPHTAQRGREATEKPLRGATKAIRKRGRKPLPIVEFPEPLPGEWTDPSDFAEAFALQLRRHGDSSRHLHKAILLPEDRFDAKTLRSWSNGIKLPGTRQSFDILARIERRYRLPKGYFRAKLRDPVCAPTTKTLSGIGAAERRRLAWHLPDDFDVRPEAERAEIVDWVRTVIISGSTEYRRFQAEALKVRYALRFPTFYGADFAAAETANKTAKEKCGHARIAPKGLSDEVARLLRFKSSTLTEIGVKRSGVWGEETASQKADHLGLMFGALAADPDSVVSGGGVPMECLTLALLAFPSVWDWYLQWRETRRGFFTAWEIDMLALAGALTRRETGWLRQNPELAKRLRPIPGLLTQDEVDTALRDWNCICDLANEHVLARTHQIQRVVRVHRDPFEPILAVLEDESPVSAYRRITTEILNRMPDAGRYPKVTAEATRGYLMLRLGLHLGVRQKNLRQLLVCPRGSVPRSERLLENLRCGELRWNTREHSWEVVIPSVAFKNANSTFFARQAYRLVLPDLDGLNSHIETYIDVYRPLLLAGVDDPGTFFVKSVKRNSKGAAYDQHTFYEAWRLLIQRYGIFNPYTGKGAIRGLLPHGPHNVRDVLATHILKRTGSYEQASYAIQDTPDMVARHYGRFLPQDKTALAAKILNQVWEGA